MAALFLKIGWSKTKTLSLLLSLLTFRVASNYYFYCQLRFWWLKCLEKVKTAHPSSKRHCSCKLKGTAYLKMMIHLLSTTPTADEKLCNLSQLIKHFWCLTAKEHFSILFLMKPITVPLSTTKVAHLGHNNILNTDVTGRFMVQMKWIM